MLQFHSSLNSINPEAWNALVSENQPFFEYEFLAALEQTGCVGASTTWIPQYLTLERDHTLLGAIPFYLKYDSYGEFIFDFAWARAYLQNGLAYYPKAVVGVPFTPATGERILVHPQAPYENTVFTLVEALLQWVQTRQLSSIHFLFLTQKEQKILERLEFLPRLSYQFHWKNADYQSFEDYLARLSHKRRNQIKNERKKVAALGLQIQIFEGNAIQEEHLEALWKFSALTFQRKSGEDPYLTRDFFLQMFAQFRHRLVLVMAYDGREWVAGTINFKKGSSLFGRYWGALRDYPYLHFECCFYQLIDYVIQQRIQLFEAGAQGEQKLLRGFEPALTYSAHWIAHEAFNKGIASFLEEEKKAIQQTVEEYQKICPLKK